MTMLMPLRAALCAGLALCAVGCTVYPAGPPPQRVYAPQPVYVAPAPSAVISVYIEPPVFEPPPVLVAWAPPPMLVETPAPLPFEGAVWVGGYWVWQGNWVWASGHWMAPPRPGYHWVHPYYEHRDGGVVFISGHWGAPDTVFVPPPPGLHLSFAIAAAGVVPGPRPIGPEGVFVPPPPGSRYGLIVPAPIGTPPAVVTSAAPVVNVGMRIQANTTINNSQVNNVRNVTNITNVTNVTIVAPPGATANGQAFRRDVPAQAHLAAALPAVVRVAAPAPAAPRSSPTFDRRGEASAEPTQPQSREVNGRPEAPPARSQAGSASPPQGAPATAVARPKAQRSVAAPAQPPGAFDARGRPNPSQLAPEAAQVERARQAQADAARKAREAERKKRQKEDEDAARAERGDRR